VNLRFSVQRRRSGIGFTILELMLSIGIFALILTAIYSIWIAILKGSRAGQKAAAEVQRARVTMRAVEGAFNGAVRFQENLGQGPQARRKSRYTFIAGNDGDMAFVEFAARLPEGFLGGEQYQQLQQKVRRIRFSTESGKDGTYNLLMTQWPILLPENPATAYQPYTITLAKEVTHFQVLMFDTSKGEWLDQWTTTNLLPKIVQIALGLGKSTANGKASEVVYSVVSLPSDGVGAGVQGLPGGLPPGALPPGSLPPGSGFPGGTPGGPPPGARGGNFPKGLQ
jgi:type II secretion system protein J